MDAGFRSSVPIRVSALAGAFCRTVPWRRIPSVSPASMKSKSVAASCPLPASFAPRTEPLFNLRPLLSGFRGMARPLTASPSCPSPEYASALIPKACAGGVFLCRGTAREALPLTIAPPSGRSRNYNSTCTGAWIARLFSVTSQSSARTRTPAACAFWSAWPKAG